MIGKIMSEAAHSIIGMLSAKPINMEHKASNSDFGSLLQSPEEQPHSGADLIELDVPEAGNSLLDDADSAVGQNMGAEVALPNIIQKLTIPAWDRRPSFSDLEPQEKSSETTTVETPNLVPERIGIDPVASVRTPIERVALDPLTADFALPTPKTTGQQKVGDILAEASMPASPLPLPSQDKSINGSIPYVLERGSLKEFDTSNYGTVTPFSNSETARPGVTVASLSLAKAVDSTPTPSDNGKLDPKNPAQAFELPLDHSPLATQPTPPAVREPAQPVLSFDLSTPRIAERLAAEIAVLSVSGETKKFEINPRNLGRMEIMFTTRGSTEIIEIQTEYRAAKDIIIQHSQVLQDMLKSQGREDLTFRVDVKENMGASSRADSGNQFQQESRDMRDHQSRSARSARTLPAFDAAPDSDAAPDNSRYA